MDLLYEYTKKVHNVPNVNLYAKSARLIKIRRMGEALVYTYIFLPLKNTIHICYIIVLGVLKNLLSIFM